MRHARAGHNVKAVRLSWATLALSYAIVVLVNLRLAHFDRAALGGTWTRYITSCFGNLSLYPVFECALLYQIICYLRNRIDRWPLIYVIPAAFFAFWAIEGRYFDGTASVDFFGPERFFTLLCLMASLGYFCVYYLAFVGADLLLSRVAQGIPRDESHAPRHRIVRWIEAHPFLTTIILLTIFSIPLYYISYPALFMGDTRRQVKQALGVDKLYYMHPVVHTLLIRVCLKFGMGVLGSENRGMFLYVIAQGAAMIMSIAFCVRTLVKDAGIRVEAALLVPLVFLVHPRCHQYLVQVTKDTLFCAFLLSFLCCTMRIMRERAARHELIWWTALALLVILFRRDGLYIIVPTVLLVALVKGARAKAVILLAVVLAFVPFWDHVVMSLLDVQPGSSRVMYSLVFQGTARYLKEHPDDVTPEERAAIDAVLHYGQLAEKYDPELSDHVIRTYRETATKEDRSAYFSATLAMFRRHPDVFLRAICNNKYAYFYRTSGLSRFYNVTYSHRLIPVINEANGITHLSMPDRQFELYLTYQSLREGFWHLPGLGILTTSFAAVVTSLFLLCYALRRRLFRELILLMVVLMQVAIVFAGPTNGGYFRYTFPIVMVLTMVSLAVCQAVSPGADTAAERDETPSMHDIPNSDDDHAIDAPSRAAAEENEERYDS